MLEVTTERQTSQFSKDPETTADKGEPSIEAIRVRAYQLYLTIGGQHGHDLADWFAAERDLRSPAQPKQTKRLRSVKKA